MKDVFINHVRITNASRQEITDYIERNIAVSQIVGAGINSDTFIHAYRDKNYSDFLKKADFINIDGMSVVLAMRLLGYNVTERVSCPDIYYNVLDLACKKQLNVFFVGSTEDVIQKLVSRYQTLYPNLLVVGYRNGYFEKSEEEVLINHINSSGADIVFLGLPSPKKEWFIRDNRNLIKANFLYGVGGMFDVEAQIIKRAPLWVQNSGFEWFFRLMQEPKRLWKRYLINNTLFIKIVLAHYLSKQRKDL